MTVVDRGGAGLLPVGSRLLDDELNPSLLRADTMLADVEGLLHGHRPFPAPSWPLIAALRQAWSQAEPLVWLAGLPITEMQSLEKARLAGTTVRVEVSHGSPRTLAAWTDVSRQAAAHGPALAGITDLLAHQVAVDTDRMVAQTLASLATFSGGANVALAAIGQWPGRRLVVLAPNAMGEMRDWLAYAQASGGSITVVADPYIVENLCIATAGVALGIFGPERLTRDQPSHLGIDVSDMVTFALEVAPGAIATWESTGFGGSGGTNPLPSPLLTSITPNTITAGSPDLLTVLVGSNFDPSMSARVTRAPNPPLYVPATYNTITEATMVMPASQMLSPGIAQVHVVVPSGTPSPESNTVNFTITAPPTPTLTNITPDRAGAGAIDKIVFLEGTGFTPAMEALSAFGAEAALVTPTVYISPTTAFFTLPAAQMDLEGTVQISVRVLHAPADSNTLPFEILVPLVQPTLTDITPDDALAGTTGVVVTMTGTNFADPMSARLNILSSGQVRDIQATVISPTSATFVMPDDLVDVVGERVDVQAYVWLAVPALSAEQLPFRATSVTPTLTSLTPNAVNTNAPNTTVTMRGSGFEQPTFAVLSGVPGSWPVSIVDPTEGTFVIPAMHLVNAAVIDVLARVTDANPSDSNTLPFTVAAAPILTDITPDEVFVQDGLVTITATGSNFTPDCILYVTNTAMQASTVISPTQMTGQVSMGIGTVDITVRDNMGNTSAALPFLTFARTPTLTNITPDQANLGVSARVTFDGTDFLAGMHFYEDGTDRGAVTIVSPTQCYANFTPNAVGTDQLHVGYGTGSGGGKPNINSNDLPLTIILASKDTHLTQVTPFQTFGSNTATLTITGSGFTGPGTAKAKWYIDGNSTDLGACAVQSDSQMTIAVNFPGGTKPIYCYVTAWITGNNDMGADDPGESRESDQIQWLA